MSAQHAVIVGGSSGIGLATGRELLRLGYKATITGRSEARLGAAREALAGDVSAIVMDAADPGRVRQIFEGIGPFDHLVLALGSGKGIGPFASGTIQ
jgi:NAD(P)-dependent dehydrogenase (short-subunit alcohol dehydrogenase family)